MNPQLAHLAPADATDPPRRPQHLTLHVHTRADEASPGDETPGRRDRELVARALDGEADAMERLVARLRCVPRIVRARRRCLRGAARGHDMEDVVQEVLLSAWANLPAYRGDAALETWLFRFCAFAVGRAFRRALRPAPLLAPVPNASDRHEHDAASRVEAALQRLPPADAELVRRRAIDADTFDQIARDVRQPPAAVKSRYYRAIVKLRAWLDPVGP